MDSNSEQPPKGLEIKVNPKNTAAGREFWKEALKGKTADPGAREMEQIIKDLQKAPKLPPVAGGMAFDLDDEQKLEEMKNSFRKMGVTEKELDDEIEKQRQERREREEREKPRERAEGEDLSMPDVFHDLMRRKGVSEEVAEKILNQGVLRQMALAAWQSKLRDDEIGDPTAVADLLVNGLPKDLGLTPADVDKVRAGMRDVARFIQNATEITDNDKEDNMDPLTPEEIAKAERQIAESGGDFNQPPRSNRPASEGYSEDPEDDGLGDEVAKSSEELREEVARYYVLKRNENNSLINDENRALVENYRGFGMDEDTLNEILKSWGENDTKESRLKASTTFAENVIKAISSYETKEEVNNHVDDIFQRYGGDIRKFDPGRYAEWEDRKNRLRDAHDLNELKDHSKKFVQDIAYYLHGFSSERGGRGETVQSAEELFRFIMDAESSKFRTGGEFELIDEKGEMHEENFMAWIRDKIMYYDSADPDDPIQLMSAVSISTAYRTINFNEMYSTPKYFMKKQSVPFRDKNGNKVIEIDPRTGEENEKTEERTTTDARLDKLKNKALYEVWPFGDNHNNNANYVASMGQAKALQEALPKAHYKNLYTKDRKRFLAWLKMAGIEDMENDMDDALDGDKFQGTVGKTHQRALLAYAFIPDRDMFRKILNNGEVMEEHSESLKMFYKSIVEQVFEEKMNILRQEKKAAFVKANFGRKPTDYDISTDIFGVDKKRFFQLLNTDVRDPRQKAQGLRDVYKESLAIEWDDFEEFMENPEFAALRALKYRFGNNSGAKLEKVSHLTNKAIDYDVFNIYSQVKREELHIAMVRKAIREGLLKQIEVDREAKSKAYEKYLSKKVELDAEFRGREDTEEYKIAHEKIRVRKVVTLDKNDEDYEAKLRRQKARQLQDTEYGELWAFRETYWMGISAMNDTNAIGFDKWSNEINLKDYRMRQGNGRGGFGMEDTVWGIKRLAFDFLHGLHVKKEGATAVNTPLIEVLQGGEGDKVNLVDDIENFDFEGNAQRQWLVDNVMPAFKLAAFFIDEYGMEFDKFFKLDFRGKLIIDKKKAEEVLQGFVFHDLRYVYDQGGYNWDKKMRTWWLDYEADGKAVKRFGVQTMKEHTFDKQVQNMHMYRDHSLLVPATDDDGNIRKDNEGNVIMIDPRFPSGQGNSMGRDVFAYVIGKELAYRRRDARGAERWELHQVQQIKEYFEQTMGYGLRAVDKKGNPVVERDGIMVAVDKNNPKKVLYKDAEVARVEHSLPFFTEHEWEESIAELADAKTSNLKRSLLMYILWTFLWSSTWGVIKEAPKIVK